MNIGQKNKLQVSKISAGSIFLRGDDGSRIPLAGKHSAGSMHVNDTVDAFLYKDSDGNLAATLEQPLIQLNSFGYLLVKEVTPFGAFLDWGLEKDLFLPFSEQNTKMEEGRKYVVYLYLDEDTERLVASNKINKFLSDDDIELQTGEKVDLLVFKQTDLGFKVIINSRHEGLIYHNEIFQPLQIGDMLKGYIKTVREDGKIDVSLQKSGFQNMDANTTRIVDYLKSHKGFLALTDSSSPDEIAALLNMSKKNFKKALGTLYKKRIVRLEEDGVHLVSGE